MRQPNDRLTEVMRRANCSNSGLANRVIAIAAEHGVTLHCDHNSVRRWLSGVAPHGLTPCFIADALSRKLGHPVSLAEIGMADNSLAAITTAIRYPDQVSDSIDTIASLVKADLAGAISLGVDNVDPAAWSDVMVRWLVAPDLRPPDSPAVLAAPIDAVVRSTALFSQIDYRFGGGYARSSLVTYVDSELTPLLRGPRRTSPDLLRAGAALLRLTGWTAYDTGQHALATRYLTQALRLAQASGDAALGGRILACMSHQANFLGYHDQAVNLARAAQHSGRGQVTPTAMALFHAMEARALAGRGDREACERALIEADRWFGQRRPEDDPTWLHYFDRAELAAEFAHSYRDLGMHTQAVEHAATAIDDADPLYVRSRLFCMTVKAAAHVIAGEVEQGIALGDEVISSTAALRSGRCVVYVRDFISRIEPYQGTGLVTEFIERATLALP